LKPLAGRDPCWGGYVVEFKIADNATFDKHKDNWAKLQTVAETIDSNQGRKFKIDISKYEWCTVLFKRRYTNY